MIDLLYLSHTAVPSHLEELEGLDLLGPEEQVLVALDGVLLDQKGRRISGPTLHDYCLLTSMRVLLWARDYGRHLCYAFPLTELCHVEGVGLDPLHAHLHLAFAEAGEEEQRFTLTLLPLADLPAAVTLMRLAADTAQLMASQGIEPSEASAEIIALLSAQIFGSVDEEATHTGAPYRWPGAENTPGQADESASAAAPGASSFPNDWAGLPPGQIYNVSRVGRAAWDTLNRTLREAELPFATNGNDIRSVAEAIRALNDLLTTVAGNPGAREVVLAFLRRRGGGGGGDADSFTAQADSSAAASPDGSDEHSSESSSSQAAPSDSGNYHEIPLRRREQSVHTALQPTPLPSDRGDTIPLRRRGGERRS